MKSPTYPHALLPGVTKEAIENIIYAHKRRTEFAKKMVEGLRRQLLRDPDPPTWQRGRWDWKAIGGR